MPTDDPILQGKVSQPSTQFFVVEKYNDYTIETLGKLLYDKLLKRRGSPFAVTLGCTLFVFPLEDVLLTQREVIAVAYQQNVKQIDLLQDGWPDKLVRLLLDVNGGEP